MIVTHRVRAFLVDGGDELPLLEEGNAVTFDTARAPHVEATLAVDASDLIAALDPRAGARVRIESVAQSELGAQSRTFDLGLRSRPIRHTDGTATLSLASDEALLADWAPLADDIRPYDLSSSVASIVNYVLGVVIPGAALHPSSASGSSTPIYDVQNVLLNPNARNNTANWSATGATLTWSGGGGLNGVSGYIQAGLTGTAAQVRPVATASAGDAFTVSPGAWWTATAHVRTAHTGMTARMRIRWLDERGNPVGDTAGPIVTPNTSLQRVGTSGVAPFSAVKGFPYLDITGANTNVLHVDAAMFHAGRFPVNYFDGDTSSTPTYNYAWAGTAHASTSSRTALIDGADPEALVWSAGQSALDFLAPIVQAAGLRLVCDEARTWTLRPETYTAPGVLAIRDGVNLIDGTDTIDLDSDLWCDAAVTVYRWMVGGVQRERVDAWALRTPYRRVRRFERATAYPGPGFSRYAVRRAQGRGREVEATRMADWSVRPEQSLEVTLPGTPPQVGAVQALRYDLDRNTMTVIGRTTDTPTGSIDLLAGTIDSLAGTIDSL